MLRIPIFALLCFLAAAATASLETVSDDDLLNLIKTENYVVALFTKNNCEKCDVMENKLLRIREDLVELMSAWVVRVANSQMLRLYSPHGEPAIVFFRKGIPLLYDGPDDEDEIIMNFQDNKTPIVKELTDDTFEHLTQASSGATTGDWFVMFYSSECVDCQRLGARWEAVGAKVKKYGINVARVNKGTTGAATARRFKIHENLLFVLFRRQKMYRYIIPKHDVQSLVSFAREWYKNIHGEDVPVPQSPFDDLVLLIVNFLKENQWVMKLGSIIICVLVIVTVASKLRKKTEVSQKKD